MMSSSPSSPDSAATELALLVLRAGLLLVLGAFLALAARAARALSRHPSDADVPPGAALAPLGSDGRPGSRIPLRGRGPLCIGRDPNCAIRVNDAFVSARHARLEWDPAAGSWCIEDDDSRNGTWLNDRRVAHSPLRDGDVVRVGNSAYVFTLSD
jgi:hypothetical protein